jgi:hypothetical protein
MIPPAVGAGVALPSTPQAPPAAVQPISQPAKVTLVQHDRLDFIASYTDFADVFEMPREAHGWLAIQLLASTINGNVFIPWGGTTYTLDLWVLLLSESGEGRNTATYVAAEVVEAAKIKGLMHEASWGSAQALYQQLAEFPRGLYVWPELSVVLRTLDDPKFRGVKEWLTDRFDNPKTPDTIRYRKTGGQHDTPPIEFQQAPRINILATSSRDWFINGLEPEDTTGGFIPRWVLVSLGKSGRLLPKPLPLKRELIPALAQRLRAISGLQGEADLSGIEPEYGQWYRAAHARFQSQPNPALATPFFKRLRGVVLKLAVIFEVSQSGSLRVSERAMRRAIEAASELEKTIFQILPTGLNREGSEVEKMAERIRSAGPKGMTKSELTLAFKHWKSKEREERLKTLYESGTVRRFYRQTGGRTAMVFVNSEHLESHSGEYPEDRPIP